MYHCSYRKLALKFHPIKNESVGAEEKFTEIAEAYDILSNRKSFVADIANSTTVPNVQPVATKLLWCIYS